MEKPKITSAYWSSVCYSFLLKKKKHFEETLYFFRNINRYQSSIYKFLAFLTLSMQNILHENVFFFSPSSNECSNIWLCKFFKCWNISIDTCSTQSELSDRIARRNAHIFDSWNLWREKKSIIIKTRYSRYSPVPMLLKFMR